ncbi:hypothetical protein BT93_I1206 [Corymbia citriodora subsp. variegata]|nr:hypothetical protein BT93_I1206 [Corymbia citriodora subsp. variegata]
MVFRFLSTPATERCEKSEGMAKEADLKKIELKVSVDCCDGCKKKVKKALQAVEGVLKTEIDPSQPKVTVLGNVDPHVLIKKLARVGKQAEVWTRQNKNDDRDKREKETPKTGSEPAKCSESNDKPKGKSNEAIPSTDGGKEKASKKNKETDNNKNNSKETDSNKNNSNSSSSSNNSKGSANTEAMKTEAPLPSRQPESNNVMYPIPGIPGIVQGDPKTQCFYLVEPRPMGIPYYAVCSYMAPVPPTSYGQEYYSYERQPVQMEIQAPFTRVGDYFNDDNTVGCHVM